MGTLGHTSAIVLLGLLPAEADAATKNWKIRKTGTELSGSIRAVQAGDIDGDGVADLVALHQDEGRRLLTVLWGDGKGGLSSSNTMEVPLEAAYCDLGDLTGEPGEEIAFLTPTGVSTVGKSGRKLTQTVLVRRDGTERFIETTDGPIRNSNSELVGVVFVFRDISERIIAERKILESESRFRVMADAAPVLI